MTCVPAAPVVSAGEGGASLSAGGNSRSGSKAVDLVVGILETACLTARSESEALACPTEPSTGERRPPTEAAAAAAAGVAAGGGSSKGRLAAHRTAQGSPSLPSLAPPTPALRQLPRLQAAALDVLRSSRAIQHMCMQAAGLPPTATAPAAAVAATAYSEPSLTTSPSSVAEKAVSPSTSFTPGPAAKGSMPSDAASDGGSSYTSSWEDEESDRSSAAVAAAAAALGRDMAAACMCVGGVSVLSPRLRYLYDGWFVPHEDQAVHEFTRQA